MSQQQASRLNAGKPELDYLLTFVGLTQSAFRGIPDEWMIWVLDFGEWYRGERGVEEIEALVERGYALLDPDWPAMLCHVSTAGAAKYAVGNYLLGFKWRVPICCLLRHVVKKYVHGEVVDPESQVDHDGHIAWNFAMLEHCYRMHPDRDDRVRAPRETSHP